MLFSSGGGGGLFGLGIMGGFGPVFFVCTEGTIGTLFLVFFVLLLLRMLISSLGSTFSFLLLKEERSLFIVSLFFFVSASKGEDLGVSFDTATGSRQRNSM